MNRNEPSTTKPADRVMAASKGLTRVPQWVFIWISPLFALLLSFIVVGILVALLGESPWLTISTMINGIIGSWEGIGYALYYSTNFVFTGLCVGIAFHANLINIGGEGQAHFAGLCLAIVILAFDSFLTPILLIPLALLAAIGGGAVWAMIPGWLQAWRGSHIVITTIMFNFIASGVILWIVLNFLLPSGQSGPETRGFSSSVSIPFFHDFVRLFSDVSFYSPLSIMFPISLLLAFLVWLALFRTRWGYNIRVFGQNPNAAGYAGIPSKMIILSAMGASGAMAAMMAFNETLIVNQKLIVGFTSGYGFVGIAVSLMGRNHPLGIVLAAILFGCLYQGGNELSFEIPALSRDMVVVVQGLIILFVGALSNFLNPLVASSYRGWHRLRISIIPSSH